MTNRLKYHVEYSDNCVIKVTLQNPFATAVSLQQHISCQDLVNEAVMHAFRKSVEMALKKAMANNIILNDDKKRTELYNLLSQCYQPNTYAEMLTKLQAYSKALKGIEEYESVVFFLEKHLAL